MMIYTWIDYLVIGIFVLSMLVGLKRGFVREIIALCTLVAAFVIAITFSGKFADWMSGSAAAESIVNSLARVFGQAGVTDALSLITLGLSFFILFILTMIVGEIINHMVSGLTKVTGIGLLDHVLGILFGAIRGFLLTVVVLFLLNLTSVPQEEAWTQSRLLPNFQTSIIWLANVVKPELQVMKDKVGKALQNVNSNSTYTGIVQ